MTGKRFGIALLTSLALFASAQAQLEPFDKLADDFWTWRAKYAPFTGDDVNRLERPRGIRDWSRASIDQRRNDLKQFETRWKNIDPSSWPVSQQVDYKLIDSALSRVRWGLYVNPRWKRDPNFYVEQTLTALAEALTVPAPYGEARSREILTRIENIPPILQQGSENLDNPPAPFASVAIQNLDGIRERLRKMSSALIKSTTLSPERFKQRLRRSSRFAGEISATAQREAAEASAANSAGSRRVRLVFAKCRTDAVHAGGTVGNGTPGMESSRRV